MIFIYRSIKNNVHVRNIKLKMYIVAQKSLKKYNNRKL